MSGGQPFAKRITIPLLVIASTISILGLGGYSLLNLSPNKAVATGTPQITSTQNPVDDTNGQEPSVAARAVVVLNASSVTGLASKYAKELEIQSWTIERIGNWTGQKMTKSTIYYPADQKASALELSAVLGVRIVPAKLAMSKTALTFVISQ